MSLIVGVTCGFWIWSDKTLNVSFFGRLQTFFLEKYKISRKYLRHLISDKNEPWSQIWEAHVIKLYVHHFL